MMLTGSKVIASRGITECVRDLADRHSPGPPRSVMLANLALPAMEDPEEEDGLGMLLSPDKT